MSFSHNQHDDDDHMEKDENFSEDGSFAYTKASMQNYRRIYRYTLRRIHLSKLHHSELKESSIASAQDSGHGDDKISLAQYLVSELFGSQMMYSIGYLRQAIVQNAKLPLDKRIRVEKPELIMSQYEDSKTHKEVHRFLKHSVHVNDIIEFVRLNKYFLEKIPNSQVNTDRKCVGNFYEMTDLMQQSDSEVIEFNDQFNTSQCVYCIVANNTQKRINVFFRGSVSGGRDWSTNFDGFLVPCNDPLSISPVQLSGHRRVWIHRGFNKYLNQKLNKTTGAIASWCGACTQDTTTKFLEIESILIALLSDPKYKDFRLNLSGHSLGGAMAQLLAFQLARCQSLARFPKACPMIVITYGCPRVGGKSYQKAFQQYEEKGLLRHIRVANKGDVIPQSLPGRSWRQTGMEFFVKRGDRMDVSYQVPTVGQRAYCIQGPAAMLHDHKTLEYFDRLFADPWNVAFLEGHTIEEIFAGYGDLMVVA